MFLHLAGYSLFRFSGESLEGAEREPPCASSLSKQEKCNGEKLSGLSDRNPQRDQSLQGGCCVCWVCVNVTSLREEVNQPR